MPVSSLRGLGGAKWGAEYTRKEECSSAAAVTALCQPATGIVTGFIYSQVIGGHEAQGSKSPSAGTPSSYSSSSCPRRPDQPLINNGAHNFHSYP